MCVHTYLGVLGMAESSTASPPDPGGGGSEGGGQALSPPERESNPSVLPNNNLVHFIISGTKSHLGCFNQGLLKIWTHYNSLHFLILDRP